MTDKPTCETCKAWKPLFIGVGGPGAEGNCHLQPTPLPRNDDGHCMQHIPNEVIEAECEHEYYNAGHHSHTQEIVLPHMPHPSEIFADHPEPSQAEKNSEPAECLHESEYVTYINGSMVYECLTCRVRRPFEHQPPRCEHELEGLRRDFECMMHASRHPDPGIRKVVLRRWDKQIQQFRNAGFPMPLPDHNQEVSKPDMPHPSEIFAEHIDDHAPEAKLKGAYNRLGKANERIKELKNELEIVRAELAGCKSVFQPPHDPTARINC